MQHPQKLIGWAAIFGDLIFGSLFLEYSLSGELYLNIIENDQNYYGDRLIFQQDDALPH